MTIPRTLSWDCHSPYSCFPFNRQMRISFILFPFPFLASLFPCVSSYLLPSLTSLLVLNLPSKPSLIIFLTPLLYFFPYLPAILMLSVHLITGIAFGPSQHSSHKVMCYRTWGHHFLWVSLKFGIQVALLYHASFDFVFSIPHSLISISPIHCFHAYLIPSMHSLVSPYLFAFLSNQLLSSRILQGTTASLTCHLLSFVVSRSYLSFVFHYLTPFLLTHHKIFCFLLLMLLLLFTSLLINLLNAYLHCVSCARLIGSCKNFPFPFLTSLLVFHFL